MYQFVQLPSFQLRPIVFACLAALSTLSLPAHAADAFTPLGDLAGGSFSSEAYGINADGTVVVGRGASASGFEAFRWTQAGGMVGLGDLAGGAFYSFADSVSSDGSVIVGLASNAVGYEAFRWTQAGGMVGLGYLAGGVSLFSEARGVNADGTVVIGQSTSSSAGASGYEAYRWTQAGGMLGLGDLAGGGFSSSAYGVSADGTVVIGEGASGNGLEAFRWTQAGGLVGLGDLAGGIFKSEALGVNADGTVVVGQGSSASGYEAFRWTQAGGMLRVADWLSAAGVVVTAGHTLNYANAVSADGSVVVGSSTGPSGQEAFLARVSVIGSGVINPVVFNQGVLDTGSRALQAGAALPGIILQGAHHRIILDNGLVRTANGACAWATGDIGRSNESDSKMGAAEVGVCKDLGSARIGVGIGQNWAKQDLRLGGNAKYRGQHVLLEAANAFDNGLQPSIIGYYGSFDTTINRHYQNGGAVDTSRGTPDASAKAIKLRLDWKDLAQLGNVSISPYAAYTWQSTKLDGYTETGGGFPVRYDSNRWNTNDVRLGAAGNIALNTSTSLRVGVEAVHRFDHNVSGTSGQVLGLGSFKVDGVDVKQTWLRATADIDHKLSEQLLITAGGNAGSGGGDTSWGLTAGLRANF